MKIAVFGINYYPELTGIGVYTTEMCEHLAAKGHEMHVYTAFPYYPFGHSFSSWYKQKGVRRYTLCCSETIRGVEARRCNLYVPQKPNTLARVVHEATFISLTFMRALCTLEKYDLVICISPPFLLGLVAIVFARLKKAPLILHVQDLQLDAAVDLEMLRNRVIVSILRSLEGFIYKRASYIMTISEAMRHKIISKGVAKEKVGLLLNWADAGNIIPLDRKNSFSRRHRLDNKFVVLHAGNMGEKQDMNVILEAARAMKDDPFVLFLLVGRGTKRAHVEHYIARHGLTNMLVLDVQPKGALSEMFSSCDAALIAQRKGVGDCVMPSKVFGPACAEKPLIIASRDDCEISKLARTYNFGIVVPPEDAAALVAAIYHLKENRAMAEGLGRNGRNFIVQDRQLEKVLDRFEKEIILRHGRGKA